MGFRVWALPGALNLPAPAMCAVRTMPPGVRKCPAEAWHIFVEAWAEAWHTTVAGIQQLCLGHTFSTAAVAFWWLVFVSLTVTTGALIDGNVLPAPRPWDVVLHLVPYVAVVPMLALYHRFRPLPSPLDNIQKLKDPPATPAEPHRPLGSQLASMGLLILLGVLFWASGATYATFMHVLKRHQGFQVIAVMSKLLVWCGTGPPTPGVLQGAPVVPVCALSTSGIYCRG